MSMPYYKAFNLNHAKDGAPYKTRDGQTVTVVEWDGKNANWPILAYYGTPNKVGQWNTKGDCLSHTSCNSPLALVMVPLGFIDGDPVYTGDRVLCDGKVVEAHCSMKDFASALWVSSEKEAAGVPPFEHNLTQVYSMLGVNEYGEALDEIGRLQTAASALKAIYGSLGVNSDSGALHVIGHFRAEIKSKSALNTKLSDDLTNAMYQRDHNYNMADSLANVIAKTFNRHIGEHSNVNEPWANALEIIEDAQSKMFVEEQLALAVAADVFAEALPFVTVSIQGAKVTTSYDADIQGLMADAFMNIRRKNAELLQETESEIKNPAGFGHG